MNTNPEYYGLPKRTKLETIENNHVAIIKRIKSRIITKDALKIIEMASLIQQKDSNIHVSLICNNNICSKSIKLLQDHSIRVIH